jgi:hypothetical protein
MSQERLKSIWSQLPAWGALVLGFGALLGQDARADALPVKPSAPEALKPVAARSDEVAVRLDGDNISISRDGRTFEELRLGNTAEAAHLKNLLRDAGAMAQPVFVPVGAMIVASGGGSGKGEKPRQQPTSHGDNGKSNK